MTEFNDLTIGDHTLAARVPVVDSEDAFVPAVNKAYCWPATISDITQDINENKKVLLTGHTGTGKTSLFMQLAARIGQPVMRSNMNGQITVGDFVGMWTVQGGQTVWTDGVLPYCMRHGFWLVLDELDFAEPAILAVLNSVLEPKGSLMLKEKGHEVVRPHKDFRLFATANTVGCMQEYRSLYQGTGIINEAFLDRWRVYLIDYLKPEDEAKVIAESVPRMRENITQVMVRVMSLVRESFKKDEIRCTFSTRRGLDWAELMVRHRHPLKAAESSIFSKVSPEDAETIKGIIKRVMNLREE